MSAPPTVKQLCNAIHVYYTAMEKGDTYLDDKGVGKFEKYCDENGIEDGDLEDNFEDAEECMLVEFDDEFPLQQQGLDEAERNAAIFAILQRCKDNVNNHDAIRAVNSNLQVMNQDGFDKVTTADIEKVVKPLYQKYCPAIFNKGMSDDVGLLTMLAFQHKHKIDYLANLVDSYNRYRVHNDSSISPNNWAKQAENKHFSDKSLKKVKVKVLGKESPYEEFATSAIASFIHRCCSKLMVDNNPKRIDDSIENFVQYLDGAIDFVRGFLKQQTSCPFQIDFCIAVAKVKVTSNDDNATGAQDDEEDDDDDDDAVGGDEPDEQKQNQQGDWIQNIPEKLKENKLKHAQAIFPDADKTATGKARNFGGLFKRFLDENKVQEIDDNGTHYMRHKRLIGMVDRRADRKKGKDDASGDHVYFYEPPDDHYTRNMPTGDKFVNEWFVSSSRTCLLPNVGYDVDDVVGNKKVNTAENSNQAGANIGAADHVTGSLVTLSFHVFSTEKIKLYLYWNGGMIRFLPEDVKLILPNLFVESDENTAYIADKDGELDGLIAKMEQKLVDKEFEQWMATYNVPRLKSSAQ